MARICKSYSTECTACAIEHSINRKAQIKPSPVRLEVKASAGQGHSGILMLRVMYVFVGALCRDTDQPSHQLKPSKVM